MNGWSALHWACYRNHARVVKFLLSQGADAFLQNTKGQTPYDLAKSDEVRAMLPQGENVEPPPVSTETTEGASLPIIPNYLANPDLLKSWAVPDDLDPEINAPQSSGESQSIEQVTADGKNETERWERISTETDGAGVVAPAPAPNVASIARILDSLKISGGPTTASKVEKRMCSSLTILLSIMIFDLDVRKGNKYMHLLIITGELLIYKTDRGDQNLCGAVFVKPTDTIRDTITQMHAEIDDFPGDLFSFYRHNGKRNVPINKKQYGCLTWDHFAKEEDVIVIVSNDSSHRGDDDFS
ncbi:Ankyrin repeat domain-containing protein 40 [Quaeritorhiza haematococci]|nr:Ankyrin repeat domain-containing protein 40 [Quaeritorhiza haematococci]